MQLARVVHGGKPSVAILEGDRVRLLAGVQSLSDLLHATSPSDAVRAARVRATSVAPLADVTFLPPIDQQEVWAAGVTYIRSKTARERESEGAARFYDLVYTADRPELFFKATARRVVGPGANVRIRQDARWSVPEPELALVVAPDLRIVGYTIGNDMSSRDIEGENPLYLPQAKVYDGSCSLGPVVTLVDALPAPEQVSIKLVITRLGETAFEGTTTLAMMARKLPDLVAWLGRDNSFPEGVILLTGTGVVPPDSFTLASGDGIAITITGIGTLANSVA